MSTFKSKTTHGRYVTIESAASVAGTVIHVSGFYGGDMESSIYLDPSDAPAIALAVMEAAGYKPLFRHNSNHGTTEALEWITYLLDKSVDAAEAKAAADDAAEAAELEREATELWNAFRDQTGAQAHATLNDLHDEYRDGWIQAARRARELATERNTK